MSNSPLEANAVYSTLGADPDLGDLVALFVEEMPCITRCTTLELSFQEANRDELARAAHQLKGAAGSYGFHQLTNFAARLERAVREIRKTTQNEQEILASLTELLTVCRKIRAGSPESA